MRSVVDLLSRLDYCNVVYAGLPLAPNQGTHTSIRLQTLKLCVFVHNVSRTGHRMFDMLINSLYTAHIIQRSQPVTMSFRVYSSVKERSHVAAPRICNKLPCELKSTKCTASFKRLLKTFSFNSACNTNWLCDASPVYCIVSTAVNNTAKKYCQYQYQY